MRFLICLIVVWLTLVVSMFVPSHARAQQVSQDTIQLVTSSWPGGSFYTTYSQIMQTMGTGISNETVSASALGPQSPASWGASAASLMNTKQYLHYTGGSFYSVQGCYVAGTLDGSSIADHRSFIRCEFIRWSDQDGSGDENTQANADHIIGLPDQVLATVGGSFIPNVSFYLDEIPGTADLECYDGNGNTRTCDQNAQDVFAQVAATLPGSQDASLSPEAWAAVEAIIGGVAHIDYPDCDAPDSWQVYEVGSSSGVGSTNNPVEYCTGECPILARDDDTGLCPNFNVTCLDSNGGGELCPSYMEPALIQLYEGDTVAQVLDTHVGNGAWHLSTSQCDAGNFRHGLANGGADGSLQFCVSATCPSGFELNSATHLCEAVQPDPDDPIDPPVGETGSGWSALSWSDDLECQYGPGTTFYTCGCDEAPRQISPYPTCDGLCEAQYPGDQQFEPVNTVRSCGSQTYTPEATVQTDSIYQSIVDQIPTPDDAETFNQDCARGCTAFLARPADDPNGLVTKYMSQTPQGFHAVDYDVLGTPQPDMAWMELDDGTWTASITEASQALSDECISENPGAEATGVVESNATTAGAYNTSLEARCRTTETYVRSITYFNDGSTEDATAGRTVREHTVTRDFVSECPTEALCEGYSHGREPTPYTTTPTDGTGDGTGGTCEPYEGDLDADGNVIPGTEVTCDLGDVWANIPERCIPQDDAGAALYTGDDSLPICPEIVNAIQGPDVRGEFCGETPVLDDQGNPVTDANGVVITTTQTDSNGDPVECFGAKTQLVEGLEETRTNLEDRLSEAFGLSGVSLSQSCPAFPLDMGFLGQHEFEIDCGFLSIIGSLLVFMSSIASARLVLV